MQNYLVKFKITDGEMQYAAYAQLCADNPQQAEAQATKLAQNFYGDNAKPEDGGFYFNAGALHVKVDRLSETTRNQAAVLSRFL